MFEQSYINAFIFGLISAVSLPLGAVTILFWKPGDKITGALIAFGGGALLAALIIDLVADSVKHGHFYPLAIGCIVGGVLFIFLNNAVNSKGGFLRKVSTTMYYLNRRKVDF